MNALALPQVVPEVVQCAGMDVSHGVAGEGSGVGGGVVGGGVVGGVVGGGVVGAAGCGHVDATYKAHMSEYSAAVQSRPRSM